eukprot:4301932-Pyramimonas_sp.AAC.1
MSSQATPFRALPSFAGFRSACTTVENVEKSNSGEELRLTIARPDDWHLHVRDDATLKAVIPHTAKVFGRAIIMPNLIPPVRTVPEALAYRERIMEAVPEGSNFQPLMTLYLTETTTPADIEAVASSGFVTACKMYPAGRLPHICTDRSDIV